MSGKTGIEWTDSTWNPVVGCERISPGCLNCYAKTLHDRRHLAWKSGRWPGAPAQYRHEFESVRCLPERLGMPLGWRKARRVFVNSMSDLFHEDVPDEFIDRVCAVMAIALSRGHTFQILTKRAQRMKDYFAGWRVKDSSFAARVASACGAMQFSLGVAAEAYSRLRQWPLPNVWLGVSVENQAQADKRIPELLRTPAAVRFLSVEPMLGAIALPGLHRASGGSDIDWVIVGGESGFGARPMHPDWARGVRDQCQAAGVAFFFKQWGEWGPVTPLYAGRDDTLEDGTEEMIDSDGDVWNARDGQPSDARTWLMTPAGKKNGRMLDGREWSEFPGTPYEPRAVGVGE